jgi:hypothetical protein
VNGIRMGRVIAGGLGEIVLASGAGAAVYKE